MVPLPRAGLTADDAARELARQNLRDGVPVVADCINATHERRAGRRSVSPQAVPLETTPADQPALRRVSGSR